MSSPPWMPLDIDDYLADTTHLTVTEHGAYMLLIMRYWKDGGLPADERLIARYARLSAEQWAESRDVLAAFFDTGWRHRRIDAELAKAADIIGKRKAAADHRHSKSNAHAEQVQNKSTYAGVPPSPKPETTSLRSEETRATRAASARFEEFWHRYPNKVGRADALKAFGKAVSRAEAGVILAGLERYVTKTDDRPWCNPATWLNQDRWTDEPAAPLARGSPSARANLSNGFDELLSDMRQQRDIRSGAGDGGVQAVVLDLPAVRRG